MSLQLFIRGLPESQAQVRQRFELVGLNYLKGAISTSSIAVENAYELLTGLLFRPVYLLLAESKKFNKTLRKGLEIDQQLLLTFECMEVLF